MITSLPPGRAWRLCMFLTTGAIILLFLVLFRIIRTSIAFVPKKPITGLVSNDTRIILFWNKFFNREHPQLHYNLSTCSVKTCIITDDRKHLHAASAVVIHAGNAKVYDVPSPSSRRPDQYYVFYLMENPYRTTPDLRQPPWPGFFNLTWTYRWDSDIVSVLYLDQFRPKFWQYPATNHSTELMKRTDKAMVLISHCAATSNRDLYIRELARYFPVAFMGECGASNNSVWEYDEEVVKQYKFYLAFENGYCTDYVTEKANRGFDHETLPVMMGSGNYSAVYPPHSYINTADFADPRDLAEYLWYLVRNGTAYEEYFAWKYDQRYQRVPSAFQTQNNDVCKLCGILNRPNPPVKTYPDIYEWWTVRSQCFTPIVTGRKFWAPLPTDYYFWAYGFLLVVFLSAFYMRYTARKKIHQ